LVEDRKEYAGQQKEGMQVFVEDDKAK